MIKKILLGSLMLLSLNTFAQESTASPYSSYGIGELKFKGTVENKSMGGLGIIPDSIHLNLQNPASLASLRLTSFSIAGTYSTFNLKSTSASEKARRTSLDYITLAIPAGRMGFSIGLIPFSSVGYKIQNLSNDDTQRDSQYTGSGGISRVFVAAGYKLTPKLSVGLDFGYNFGKLEDNSIVFFPRAQFGSRELNTAQIKGINLNTGAIYKTKYKKYDVVASLTVSPSTNWSSSNTRSTAKVTFDPNTGTENTYGSDTLVYVPNSRIKLPSRFAIGSGIGQAKKWFAGFESTFQGKSSFGDQNVLNVSYEEAFKLSIGGYYIPNYNSFSNYFSRVTYRAGLRHENTGLVVKSKSIKDKAVTFGLGLPVGGNFSTINIGLEYGKRGTTAVNLVEENYLNISIGLSFSDKWFTKRKID
jgi:hypothetical protein